MTSYNNIDTIVLIGEKKYTSIKEASPKLLYADPCKLQYEINEDTIKISDNEYTFSLNNKDAKRTIVLIKSGYKNPYIKFLIDKLTELNFIVINNPEAVNISNDKFLLANKLNIYKINQPKYILACHNDIIKGDSSILDKKLHNIYKDIKDDTKFVCKILNGHGGKGVFVCRYSNIISVLQCFFAINKDCHILVQEYLDINKGDIRVHVLTIGNKQRIISSTMRCKSGSDFRTNLSLGNSQTEYELTKEQKELALNTAKVSGLIWCGVDIAHTDKGDYVIEYNGAPGPPSEISQDSLKESNIEFYKELFKNIDEML